MMCPFCQGVGPSTTLNGKGYACCPNCGVLVIKKLRPRKPEKPCKDCGKIYARLVHGTGTVRICDCT